MARHAERHPQRSDDKSKFPDLRHTETTLHRLFQRLPGQYETERPEKSLPHDNGQGQGRYRPGILNQYFRVYQHPHRHEEDGTEQILHRSHQFFYPLGFYRLGQDGTYHKGTERRTKTRLHSHHGHDEAKRQRHDQQGLAIQELPVFP